MPLYCTTVLIKVRPFVYYAQYKSWTQNNGQSLCFVYHLPLNGPCLGLPFLQLVFFFFFLPNSRLMSIARYRNPFAAMEGQDQGCGAEFGRIRIRSDPNSIGSEFDRIRIRSDPNSIGSESVRSGNTFSILSYVGSGSGKIGKLSIHKGFPSLK